MFGNRRIRELEDEVRKLSTIIRVTEDLLKHLGRRVAKGYYIETETEGMTSYQYVDTQKVIDLILKQLKLEVSFKQSHIELASTGKTKKG